MGEVATVRLRCRHRPQPRPAGRHTRARQPSASLSGG